MSVARGTTPTFRLQFGEDIDFTGAHSFHVTFRSGHRTLDKSGTDLMVEGHTISVHLTQAECFSFAVGAVEIQANWLTEAGERVASVKVNYDISENLHNEVIE